MSGVQTKRPGDSCQSHPGQQRNGRSDASWKYTPMKRAVVLSNRDFLTQAFGRCGTDETPWVAGFPGDPNAVEHGVWMGRAALPLPPFIRDGNNNYIVVSTFRRGEDGKYHRRKDCFSGMFVVMVDDVGTKVPFDRLHLEPTCLVETSPGNFQAWYFLIEPERDRSRAEGLVRGMIASGLTADGSDPGMNGVTRYGRLPVGVNGKAKYADSAGQPFVQRVAHWAPLVRYSLDQIAHAYDVDLAAAATKHHRKVSDRRKVPAGVGGDDGLTGVLEGLGLYLEPITSLGGGHRIVCPWVHEHTDQEPSGTAYFEPSEENSWAGGFKCQHGHCQHRTIADLTHFVTRVLQKNTEKSL